nr:ribonuclease H-like domain-containing protein [Tanacetum cinerariifolium]
MRPFGCPVTILNTVDHLGKFDEKDYKGLFVGYSLKSKAFRVFNSITRIVEETLHIRFSENTLNNVGSGPNWLFDTDALTKTINYQPVVARTQSNGNASTKDNNNASQSRKEKEPGKDYILLPLWTADPPFLQEPKSSQDAGFKPSNDVGKKKMDQDAAHMVAASKVFETVMPITSAEDKAQRRLEVKAGSTLMMGIPNEHQLKFNSIKDAKSLLEATEKSLDQTFDRIQKLRNKPDLDSMSMDDLYNNLKVYELEVKGVSSSSTNTQNMAFVSSSSNNNTNSSNEAVNTAFGVTTAGTQVNAANSTNIDNLSDAIKCAFLASQSSNSQHLNLNGNETIAFDKTKVECYNCHKRGHFARECRAQKAQDNRNRESTRRNVPKTTNFSALVSCYGLGGYDWSDQAEEGPNYALMAYSTSSSDYEIMKKLMENMLPLEVTLKEGKLLAKTADLPFPQEPKNSQDDGFKPSNDVRKKVNEANTRK